jgi:hypothetical protein
MDGAVNNILEASILVRQKTLPLWSVAPSAPISSPALSSSKQVCCSSHSVVRLVGPLLLYGHIPAALLLKLLQSSGGLHKWTLEWWALEAEGTGIVKPYVSRCGEYGCWFESTCSLTSGAAWRAFFPTKVYAWATPWRLLGRCRLATEFLHFDTIREFTLPSPLGIKYERKGVDTDYCSLCIIDSCARLQAYTVYFNIYHVHIYNPQTCTFRIL